MKRKLSRDQLWILRQLAGGAAYAFELSKRPHAPARTAIDYNFNIGLINRGLIQPSVVLGPSHIYAKWYEITEAGLWEIRQLKRIGYLK